MTLGFTLLAASGDFFGGVRPSLNQFEVERDEMDIIQVPVSTAGQMQTWQTPTAALGRAQDNHRQHTQRSQLADLS